MPVGSFKQETLKAHSLDGRCLESFQQRSIYLDIQRGTGNSLRKPDEEDPAKQQGAWQGLVGGNHKRTYMPSSGQG